MGLVWWQTARDERREKNREETADPVKGERVRTADSEPSLKEERRTLRIKIAIGEEGGRAIGVMDDDQRRKKKGQKTSRPPDSHERP